MSWPSTRLRTVTLLKAVTMPRQLKYTGKSPRWAGATITGTAKLPGPAAPFPLPGAPGAAEVAAWLAARELRKYQMPTAITPRMRIQSHQRVLVGVVLRGPSTSRAPGSGRFMDLIWPIRSLLLSTAFVRGELFNPGHHARSMRLPRLTCQPAGHTAYAQIRRILEAKGY